MKTLKPGEIATYCDVHNRTVSRWIANGQLKGHKLPGRGNYRVLIEDFIQFLEQQQMPLPLDLLDSSIEPSKTIQHAPASTVQAAKILVIDDELASHNAIRLALLVNGYQLDFAANGFQAGVKISIGQPDLILLNLSMSGLDCFEVLSFIRQQPALAMVKILVISSVAATELTSACVLGADAMLTKPFHHEQLLQQVQHLLRVGGNALEGEKST